VREEIAGTGRDPAAIEILAAVKYVPAEELGPWPDAGVTLVGENRAQELALKMESAADSFTWDFIGHLQSRKVKEVLPRVRYIHSVASDSVLAQLGRHGNAQTRYWWRSTWPVNRIRAASPGGAAELSGALPGAGGGLMTMPPLASSAEENRPHFAALRELAQTHGLPQLSMGPARTTWLQSRRGRRSYV